MKSGSKNHSMMRSAHNKLTGKYKKQCARTFSNKERAWKKHLAGHPNDKMAISSIPKARDTRVAAFAQ